MNSSDNHEPSPAFRAQLKREISRAARSDEMFGPPPATARSRRVVNAVGVFAGVALTLLTGMVLGASASYASAAEPDAPRPTFAFGPVTDALNAIGCGVTKVASQVPHRSETPPTVAKAAPVVPETATVVPAKTDPDRARIAALASQYQPSVTRGDSASEYIVMILDASERYSWSTHGSGNLSIQIAGDKRTPSERREHTRQFAAELNGSLNRKAEQLKFADSTLLLNYKFALDSLRGNRYRMPDGPDSAKVFNFTYRLPGAKRQRSDSGVFFGRMKGDSLLVDYARFFVRDSARLKDVVLNGAVMRGGGGRGDAAGSAGGGGRGAARGNAASADTAATYYIGWSGSMNGPALNQAIGLDAGAGDGYSGVTGLPSWWIASGDLYRFAAGEISPQALKVLVLKLTPGTVWKGK